jgi:site-specific DNA-methyltransferase (adenine-specific)
MRDVIQGDCLEELAKLADKSIDVVVTDPPYLPVLSYMSKISWPRHYSDYSPLKVFWSAVVAELRRVLKDDGHLFVFCSAESYAALYESTYSHFDSVKALVWDKQQAGWGHIFRRQHELIIWAHNKGARYHKDGRVRGDVLRFPPTHHSKRTHPIQKPVELLAALIEPVTSQGDVVLDPFCGSGTTLVAAQALGCGFIGIEVNPVYAVRARQRLELAAPEEGAAA